MDCFSILVVLKRNCEGKRIFQFLWIVSALKPFSTKKILIFQFLWIVSSSETIIVKVEGGFVLSIFMDCFLRGLVYLFLLIASINKYLVGVKKCFLHGFPIRQSSKISGIRFLLVPDLIREDHHREPLWRG